MEPKKLYSIRWVQPYPTNQLLRELELLRDELIEQMLDAKDFDEADQVIAKVKAL